LNTSGDGNEESQELPAQVPSNSVPSLTNAGMASILGNLSESNQMPKTSDTDVRMDMNLAAAAAAAQNAAVSVASSMAPPGQHFGVQRM